MGRKESEKRISRRDFIKKSAIATAGVAAAASFLEGCAPAATPAPTVATPTTPAAPTVAPTPTEAPPPAPISLRVHHRAGVEGDVIAERGAAFTEKFPNITVVPEGYPFAEYWEKMRTLTVGGNIGDLMWGATHSGDYYMMANTGVTAPIDDFIEKEGFDTTVYIPEALEKMKLEGKLYGLPFKAHPGASAVFYNVEMFEAEGIEPPDENTTWDELVEKAIAFTTVDAAGKPLQWGIVFNLTYYIFSLQLLKALTGAEWLSEDGKTSIINSSENLEGLQWIYDRTFVDRCTPSPSEMSIAGAEYTLKDMFIAQKCPMYHSGSWDKGMAATIEDQFEWDAAPLPKGKTGSRGAHILVDTMSMTTYTEYPQEAWELLKWMTDKETGLRLGEGSGKGQSGTCGGRWDVYEDPRLRDPERTGVNPHVHDVFTQLLKEAEVFLTAWNFRDVELSSVEQNMLLPIFLGEQEPTQAYLDGVQEACQEILDKPRP